MKRRSARRTAAIAVVCLSAPSVSIAESTCDEVSQAHAPVMAHFSQDLTEWIESNPAIESYSLVCEDSEVTLQAVVRNRSTLSYSPDLDFLSEQRRFYGLAAYYNQVRAVEHSSGDTAWRGWRGRFAAALVMQEDGRVLVRDNTVELTPGNGGDVAMKLGLIESDGRGEFGGITSRESLILEEVLKSIQKITGSSWGLSVILLSALIKIALIPVSIFVARQQRRVGRIQSALEQPLRDIKASYDGQEAHERIMAAHKELGVSPFYTLKPMLGMLIQVPICWGSCRNFPDKRSGGYRTWHIRTRS
jgi:hypothetical protein